MDDKKENGHVLSNSRPVSQKMSSSLKEKLRRSSRPFSSPVSRCPAISPRNSNVQNSESVTLLKQFTLEDIETCTNQGELHAMNCDLKRQILDNEEKLRKLELVEHYNLKNKPEDLTSLIQKWLTTSQEALQKLNEKLPENKTDLSDLLKTLNIDYDIIQYDPDCDTFY